VIAIVAAAAFASAEWHGRSSRVGFRPPPELAQRPMASVGNAADAFLVWRGSGSNGRRLVLLTGQWGGPRRAPATRPGTGDAGAARAALGSGAAGDPLDAGSALYWAARLGVVRGFDVVMPPASFERRVAEDADHKAFRAEDGAYRHDLHGFWLRFSLPRAFAPPAEPTLVLIEPSWFAAGAPRDPLAWLSSVGVRTDLALVALDDPAASDEDRRAAAAYARAVKLPRLNVVRTR
jgi:hypothetical protein